jgi:hypothetical protein
MVVINLPTQLRQPFSEKKILVFSKKETKNYDHRRSSRSQFIPLQRKKKLIAECLIGGT